VAEASLARDFLVRERGIAAERVVMLYGGRRKSSAVELWVAQNGATPPAVHSQSELKGVEEH
jgi:hypothetical protein